MKILVISDEIDRGLYDFYSPSKTEGIDLIISCGDLKPKYLEFLTTLANVPVLYVRGNHDDIYEQDPPQGCMCIEDTIYDFHGLRILGLGGSMRYREGKNMYTEAQMNKRVRKIQRMIKLMNGFDILVTHAPAQGYGDMDDIAHRGFDCFNDLLNQYHPKYMLHGHVHLNYGVSINREQLHPSGTKIINGYGKTIIEIAENEYPEEGKTGNKIYDWYVGLKKK